MADKFLEKLIETPFVYHYTSVESLFAILEGCRQIKEHAILPFRAYNIYNVNDPRELKLGFDAVKKFLPEYESKIDNSMYLSEVYLDANYESICREKCYTKPDDGAIEMGIVPYTSSFSSKEDFLPMWSMYGANCKGICLKFNLSKLLDYPAGECQFGFVTYDGDEDTTLLKGIFIDLYNRNTNRSPKMRIDEKIDELSVLCACISPFVKSSDWAYEQEFRFVYNLRYGPNNDYDFLERILNNGIEKTKVIPYHYYSINPNALEEIIIGPKANYNVIEHVLRNELKECLLNDVKVTPSSIEII